MCCTAGDASREFKAYTHPYGFSHNGRYYEPGCMSGDEEMYEQATAAAFTEDVTFLFAGLPALQELEMGCYTDMRGNAALSRKLLCGPLPQAAEPHGAASGAAARAERSRGLGLGRGLGRSAAGGAPCQRLSSLKVVNALDIDGIQYMLVPSECWSNIAGQQGQTLTPLAVDLSRLCVLPAVVGVRLHAFLQGCSSWLTKSARGALDRPSQARMPRATPSSLRPPSVPLLLPCPVMCRPDHAHTSRVAYMHSLDYEEACMLVDTLPELSKQLADLDIGRGMLIYGLPEDEYLSFADLTALTSLAIDSDAGPASAMSAMFSGGRGSMPHLKRFHCRMNTGCNQLSSDGPVQGLMDLTAMAAACPGLQELSFADQWDGIFAQGVASPAAECCALRALTGLTSLALRTDAGWLECFFDNFASLVQLRELTLKDGTCSGTLYGRAEQPVVTWSRLRKLTALTNLQQLEAEPLIKVTPKLPWKYPEAADAPAGPADSQPSGSDADAPAQPQPALCLLVLPCTSCWQRLQAVRRCSAMRHT